MKTLVVDLGERSYPIYIGEGLLARADLLRPHIGGRQVMIVTNDTVAPLYLQQVREVVAGTQCHSVVLPDGEQYKNWETLNRIFDALLENHCDRRVTVIALGGGVVGDMAGFAAACYQRGVPFIQVPTTLLAQVDSSVGGKTGVNHPLGKNMIGAFHQPNCVLIDTATLHTLPDRELSAGLAEIIKYGLIRDVAFLEWLEANMDALLRRGAGPVESGAYLRARHRNRPGLRRLAARRGGGRRDVHGGSPVGWAGLGRRGRRGACRQYRAARALANPRPRRPGAGPDAGIDGSGQEGPGGRDPPGIVEGPGRGGGHGGL